MSDPFSIIAGAANIVVPALHYTRLLLKDLEHLKDAPKTIRRLAEDVQSVDASLRLLKHVDNRDWELLGTGVTENAQATSESCAKACELFRDDLQRWTKRSKDGKLEWRDRAKIGFMKQEQVKAMSEQLIQCKVTINSVVSIATLYSSVRTSHITEEIRNTMTSRRSEVQAATAITDQRAVTLERDLEDLDISSDEDDNATGVDANEVRERTEAKRQLEEELIGVKASQKLLQELLKKAQEDALAKAVGSHSGPTTVTFGTGNSGFQAGLIHGGVTGLTFWR